MKKRDNLKFIFQICFFGLFLLFTITEASAEHFFEKNSTWYEPIPDNPKIAPDSANYINDILINGSKLYVQYNDWSFPIWKAEANTPNVIVKMNAPDGTCGSSAIAKGWNIIPIPPNAKSAGMDEWCAGSGRDAHMVVFSYDGNWEWDLYQAKNCGSGWTAGCVRKRARTTAASLKGYGLGDGSGVLPKDDGMGNPRACGQSAHSHGLITYNDYLSGSIDHAIMLGYRGEKKDGGHWGYYPCLAYRDGAVDRKYAMWLGRRLQLNPSFDCNSIKDANAFTKIVCEALKKYGAIFVINTGAGYNQFYLESIYNKTNFWSDIVQNPLPFPISQFRVVEPIYPKEDTTPPASPSIIEVK